MSRVRRPFRAALALLALAFAPVLPAQPEAGAVSEHAMKAVLFYKLPQFVYLPGGARDGVPLLCGLGSHPVIEALESLARTQTDPQAPVYRSIGDPQSGVYCDFLYIARGEGGVESLLRQLKNADVVTVSDIPGFARAGGMVELAQNPDRAGVQILINRKSAQRRGIEFNAQLLRLARIVEP